MSLYSFIFRLSPLSRAERSAATRFLYNAIEPQFYATIIRRIHFRLPQLHDHLIHCIDHFCPLDLGNLNPILILRFDRKICER
ncbi:hypothetical protein M405DRAFT_209682 [Rhizopogon salebrosus TDB-379]|nr:hypothetical protein M405DRAFT_209682 [Rhizopogon salebrosus TDB-379]